jgi:uncharacterized protein
VARNGGGLRWAKRVELSPPAIPRIVGGFCFVCSFLPRFLPGKRKVRFRRFPFAFSPLGFTQRGKQTKSRLFALFTALLHATMSIAEANLELPPGFAGIVKIFPLPNLVLFPAVIQPLHIFEPRYRRMMADAINADQLIAITTMIPGWEKRPSRRPEVFPSMCIGRIVTHTLLPDGRFNLLLCGIRRAKIIREIPAELPYRMADVEVAAADPIRPDDESDMRVRRTVTKLFSKLVTADRQIDREAISGLMDNNLPIGLLLDLVTFACGAGVLEQQSVLEAVDINERGRRVVRLLQKRIAGLENPSRTFPPSFSLN